MSIERNANKRDSGKVFSINEITLLIKHVLEQQFTDIWVEGEISNFKLHSSGHMYFTLKDRYAQLRAVLFRGQGKVLDFVPRDGQVVQALGDISFYQPSGSIQLYVKLMKPGGLGDLYREFERLKAKLEAEGLFEKSRKKPLPALPKYIGVVTSPTGAAIRDMIHVIRRRMPVVRISLIPVRVQGEGAAAEIVQAIRDFHQVQPRPEVLIVGRGGGSIEDLWAFNEEIVARAIAASEIPIISAVGHEIDFTIADFVADMRAATPSAAAELVVPNKDDLLATVKNLQSKALTKVTNLMREYRLRFNHCKQSYVFKPQRYFDERRQQVDLLMDSLSHRGREHLLHIRHRIELFNNSVLVGPNRVVQRNKTRFELLKLRLNRFSIIQKRNSFEVLKARLSGHDPKAILSRGYSICERLKDSKVVTSFKQISEGQQIRVILHEGRIISTVKERNFL